MRQHPTKEAPFIPGFDIAGVVVAKGKDCKRNLKVGDSVYGMTLFRYQGGFAEYVAVNEEYVSKKPEKASFKEAAAIPLVGLTSLQVIEGSKLTKGQTILILGGTSATGMVAVQLAKKLGVRVVVTASKKNANLMLDMGADVVIDYRTEDFGDVLEAASVDVIYECVKDDKRNFPQMMKVLKPTGKIFSIEGLPGIVTDPLDALKVIFSSALGFGSQSIKALTTNNNRADQLDILADMFDRGELKVPVDKVFKLKDAAKALQYNFDGLSKGKIIVEVKSS